LRHCVVSNIHEQYAVHARFGTLTSPLLLVCNAQSDCHGTMKCTNTINLVELGLHFIGMWLGLAYMNLCWLIYMSTIVLVQHCQYVLAHFKRSGQTVTSYELSRQTYLDKQLCQIFYSVMESSVR